MKIVSKRITANYRKKKYMVITNLEDGINNPVGRWFNSRQEARDFIEECIKMGYEVEQ